MANFCVEVIFFFNQITQYKNKQGVPFLSSGSLLSYCKSQAPYLLSTWIISTTFKKKKVYHSYRIIGHARYTLLKFVSMNSIKILYRSLLVQPSQLTNVLCFIKRRNISTELWSYCCILPWIERIPPHYCYMDCPRNQPSIPLGQLRRMHCSIMKPQHIHK